jgi:two-component system, NtrC family, sensor kinase
MPDTTDDTQSVTSGDRRAATDLPAVHAALMREQRAAALRVVTGRLAHRMRNPLAAIQAACASLREELDDPDQADRLEQVLLEIRRLLDIIAVEVRAAETLPERARRLRVLDEVEQVLDTVRIANPAPKRLLLTRRTESTWLLPRRSFRVALHAVIEHLIRLPGIVRVELALTDRSDRLEISCRALGEHDEAEHPPALQQGPLNNHESLDLQIAERFARDVGGSLVRWLSNGIAQTVVIQIPTVDG